MIRFYLSDDADRFLYADKNETEINVNATIGGFLKLVFTIIRLVLITIFVSLFLYPLIHETGHWIAAKTLNIRVIEFEVFPSPHISFDFADTQSVDLVWLSLGSCVIPALLLLVKTKQYYLYFAKELVLLIWFFSGCESMIKVMIFLFTSRTFADDAVLVINTYPDSEVVIMITLWIQIIFALLGVCISGPIKRTVAFLEKSVSPKEHSPKFV